MRKIQIILILFILSFQAQSNTAEEAVTECHQCLSDLNLTLPSGDSAPQKCTIVNVIKQVQASVNVGAGYGDQTSCFVDYSELCLDGAIPDPITGACPTPPPLCTSIGIDPFSSTGPFGYCPDFPNSNASQLELQCKTGDDGLFNIPRCDLDSCPDGSIADLVSGQCPAPFQCPDGSIVYGGLALCPDVPVICPDGNKVVNESFCEKPNIEIKQCADGTNIPITATCPDVPDSVTCTDGSVVTDASLCPTQTPTLTTCQDGSKVQDSADCPVPNITDPSISDSATSTTTTTATTTNSANSTVETTTSESTTEVELNLDSTNSRLDQINKKLKEILDGKESTFTDIKDLYTKEEGLTYETVTDAFVSRITGSELVTAGSNIFTITLSSGSCPTWSSSSVSAGMFSIPPVVIDQQCSSIMSDIWPIIQVVLLAVATVYAVKIGLL